MSNPIFRSFHMATVMTNGPLFFDRLFRMDWYGGMLRNWVSGLELPNQTKILELGCGPGNLCHHLANQGHDVTGADKSERMIRRASRVVSSAKFVESDALTLPFEDNEFDVVLLSSLINIVPDRAGLLAEAARVLKPGGTLSAIFPASGFTTSRAAEISAKLKLSQFQSSALSLWASVPRKLNPTELSGELVAAGFKKPSCVMHLENSIASVSARKI